jgi:hypothetical protein
MENKIMKTKLIVGRSVQSSVYSSISLNIDTPLWIKTRGNYPPSIYNPPYKSIELPVWKLVTLEIYDELN